MLRAMAVVGLGSGALLGLLVGLLLLVQGDGVLALQMLGYALAGGLLLFGFSLVIMLLVYGNKFHTRFTVSKDGVRCQTQDRRALASNRAALVLGPAHRPPGGRRQRLAGHHAGGPVAALDGGLHGARQRGPTHDHDAQPLAHAAHGVLHSRQLRCGVGSGERADGPARHGGPCRRAFAAGRLSVAHRPGRAGQPARAAGGRALRLRAAAALPADVFCHRDGVVCAPSGLGGGGLVALQGAALLVGALAARPSAWRAGASYLRYETLSGDAWALTALAAAGLVYLAGFAVQTLRQRIRPALESDLHDGQGS
jgi:hypothetical protein